jgi:DNA-binding IscR family transcriptional regulator
MTDGQGRSKNPSGRERSNPTSSRHPGVGEGNAGSSAGSRPSHSGALRPSREFVLAADAVVYLASHPESAIPQAALAEAVGSSDAEEAWAVALERLVSGAILSLHEEGEVRLARSAQDITLADIAEVVEEELRSEANGDDGGEAFQPLLCRIWRELLEAFRAVPVSSLAG